MQWNVDDEERGRGIAAQAHRVSVIRVAQLRFAGPLRVYVVKRGAADAPWRIEAEFAAHWCAHGRQDGVIGFPHPVGSKTKHGLRIAGKKRMPAEPERKCLAPGVG